MGRNEDSLLRAASENVLASATRGGSCAHPDQSRGLARRRNLRAISGVGASSPILLFFLGGGVALHERLVGKGKATLRIGEAVIAALALKARIARVLTVLAPPEKASNAFCTRLSTSCNTCEWIS